MFGRCCPAAPRPECPARQSPSWWSRRSAPRSRPRHSRGSRLGGSTRRSGRACGRWWRCWGAGRPAQRPSSACCSASRRPDSYRKTSGRTETAARAASRCWRRQCRTQSAGRRCRAGGCLRPPWAVSCQLLTMGVVLSGSSPHPTLAATMRAPPPSATLPVSSTSTPRMASVTEGARHSDRHHARSARGTGAGPPGGRSTKKLED